MEKLVSKVYKRGSSYEITIPKALLWDLNLEKKKYGVIFKKSGSFWVINFEELKKKKNILSRKLYKKGSSFETTVPIGVLFGTKKHDYVYFENYKTGLKISFRGDNK